MGLAVFVVCVVASNVAFDYLRLLCVDISICMVNLRTHENSVLGTNGLTIVGDIALAIGLS